MIKIGILDLIKNYNLGSVQNAAEVGKAPFYFIGSFKIFVEEYVIAFFKSKIC